MLPKGPLEALGSVEGNEDGSGPREKTSAVG